MAVYSINDVEKLCGIKAHTIRIWEKRYAIIQPRRTDTNIRYYLDEDLQKILNISLLNRNGYKISKIAKLSEGEIKNIVSELSDVTLESEDNLDALMHAMLELDEFKFNKILDHNIDSKGFEVTMDEIVYPMMEKLSMMWIAGSIKGVHENFVANVIRRKTIVAIDQIESDYNPEGLRFLIYLPENETHELSLLFLHFLLKDSGINVINLGAGIPLIDVLEGQNICKADYIFTIFNDSFSESPLQPYLNELSKHLEGTTILISGYQTAIQNISPPYNVHVLKSLSDVKSFVQETKKQVGVKQK
ncbi:MAG: MerR family transcriptional regulator [Saprospiraceae bacterium]|nr:MerR family transcriptional regulator [Saprospiraceae bacterium]